MIDAAGVQVNQGRSQADTGLRTAEVAEGMQAAASASFLAPESALATTQSASLCHSQCMQGGPSSPRAAPGWPQSAA